MDKVPTDLYDVFFRFLSQKEKIMMREVCKSFNLCIQSKLVTSYKLQNRLKKLNSIELKHNLDIMCEYVDENMKLYKQLKIHTHFCVFKSHDRCIANCRSEKLGYIYHSPRQTNQRQIKQYNKRYIPYCIECFKTWKLQYKFL